MNVVIKSPGFYQAGYDKNISSVEFLFGDNQAITYIEDKYDIYDLLIMEGVFTSRSEAKKNWKKTGREIPTGWSWFEHLGRKRNKELAIYNPRLFSNEELKIINDDSIPGRELTEEEQKIYNKLFPKE